MRHLDAPLLKQGTIRQSWSKKNLYNLARATNPRQTGRTFFQVKWKAKSVLRKYHGEQVKESHWNRMFKRRLAGVVPMNASYLAKQDGIYESGGRGSGWKDQMGRDQLPDKEEARSPIPATPWMNMTFAPLERRLDTAIFRALFASSIRQARQFVVHGNVKVNGKKIVHPSYLLNPGDMFQVEPRLVMFATGAPKEGKKPVEAAEGEEGAEVQEGEEASAQAAEAKNESGPEEELEEEEEDETDIDRDPRDILRDLRTQAKSILSSQGEAIGAKKKQDLRAFSKAVQRMLGRSSSSTILTDSMEAQFAELKNQLRIQRERKKEEKDAAEKAKEKNEIDVVAAGDKDIADSELDAEDEFDPEATYMSDEDILELEKAFQSSIINPLDPSKPYATPWRPRDYMAPFAFIPKFLEVNQNICAAVYLRHPTARPGMAEVPTPFGVEVNTPAYTWYLRRR